MATYLSSSSAKTKKLGGLLAQKVLRAGPGRRATVLALSGDLGSGKTTFVQGFFRGLGVRERAVSPTFVLMRRTRLTRKKFKHAFHIDAYRVKKAREFSTLGIEEILADPQNVVLIEWAEHVKEILPRGARWVRFRHGETSRIRLISTRAS